MRLSPRRQEGAAAVEFALVAPILVILLFGVLQFGVAFLHVQTIRSAVREGARYAAVGGTKADIQKHTKDSSLGYIQNANDVTVFPNNNTGGPICNANNIGSDVTVSFDTAKEGGITVYIPLIPPIPFSPDISANFRCEV
jgi:Flp pilus assembly protein TadG